MRYLSLILSLLLFSCGHGTFIEVSETNGTYKLRAEYKATNTRSVDEYLDNYLLPLNVNGLLIKSLPGNLHITVDKTVNSPATMQQVRTICKGINFR